MFSLSTTRDRPAPHLQDSQQNELRRLAIAVVAGEEANKSRRKARGLPDPKQLIPTLVRSGTPDWLWGRSPEVIARWKEGYDPIQEIAPKAYPSVMDELARLHVAVNIGPHYKALGELQKEIFKKSFTGTMGNGQVTEEAPAAKAPPPQLPAASSPAGPSTSPPISLSEQAKADAFREYLVKFVAVIADLLHITMVIHLQHSLTDTR